jgi:hypothetical protein
MIMFNAIQIIKPALAIRQLCPLVRVARKMCKHFVRRLTLKEDNHLKEDNQQNTESTRDKKEFKHNEESMTT